MNKKYVSYGVLAMLLMINNLSFSMGTKLVRYMAGSTLVGGGYYLMNKELAKYGENILENVPCNIEKWARKNLAEKGIKNADTVPLKIDNKWITHHSYIGFNEEEVNDLEDRKKEIIAREMLFHEAKHYHNNDIDKRCLVRGLTTGILFLPHASVPRFLLKVAMVMVSNITYIRHQELEADRFAFMNVSVEDLEVCKARRLGWAELFEEHTLNDPFLNQKSWVTQSIGMLISKRLRQLNQKDDNQWQKDVLVGLADFCHDHEHPRYWRQVALVQECIDKRKE